LPDGHWPVARLQYGAKISPEKLNPVSRVHARHRRQTDRLWLINLRTIVKIFEHIFIYFALLLGPYTYKNKNKSHMIRLVLTVTAVSAKDNYPNIRLVERPLASVATGHTPTPGK